MYMQVHCRLAVSVHLQDPIIISLHTNALLFLTSMLQLSGTHLQPLAVAL
jgi:hypothetical protein